MNDTNDNAPTHEHGKQYFKENWRSQNSVYPNALTILSLVTAPGDSKLGDQFCGFTTLHCLKAKLRDGLSFSLSGDGGIGLDPGHQPQLSELFSQKLRPDHTLVLIGWSKTIGNLNACARAHASNGVDAVLEALIKLREQGRVLDLADLINRPNMTIADALKLTGNLIPLDAQRLVDAWSAESEHDLLNYYRQRNYVILFLLQALTLRPAEQYAGLLAIWQHQHNSYPKY